eukprot:g2384.t1
MAIPGFLFPYRSKLQKARFWLACEDRACFGEAGGQADGDDRALILPKTAYRWDRVQDGVSKVFGESIRDERTSNKSHLKPGGPRGPLQEIKSTYSACAYQPPILAHYWLYPKEDGARGRGRTSLKKRAISRARRVLGKTDEEIRNTRVLLHFHGGAFFSVQADASMACVAAWVMWNCQRKMNQKTKEPPDADAKVPARPRIVTLLAEYRRSPEWDVECAHQDALSLYSFFVNDLGVPTQNIAVLGDSAGGQIALQLMLRLGLLDDLHASCKNRCRVLIHSGEVECLRDVHIELAQLMGAKLSHRAETRLEVFHDLSHVGHIFYPSHPMGRVALQNIVNWILDTPMASD